MELNTWEDLGKLIEKMTPEQRSQAVQIVRSHPCEDHIHELEPGISFSTIGELELMYCRSSVDNRHHKNEFVIYTDCNPFAENGASAYELTEEGEIPIFHSGHDESADWTGPAQRILDESRKWLPFNGTAIVENDIVHLKANDAPDEKLWSILEDVKIEGDSVKVRLGGRIHGLSCSIPASRQLRSHNEQVLRSRLKDI
jgi:hypothetical protein